MLKNKDETTSTLRRNAVVIKLKEFLKRNIHEFHH